MMEEHLVQLLLEALGDDARMAYYIYIGFKAFESILVMGCLVWGCRAAWPSVRRFLIGNS